MEWLDLAEEDLLGVAGLDEGSGLVGSAGAGKIFKLYTQVIFYAEETSIQLARSALLSENSNMSGRYIILIE